MIRVKKNKDQEYIIVNDEIIDSKCIYSNESNVFINYDENSNDKYYENQIESSYSSIEEIPSDFLSIRDYLKIEITTIEEFMRD